MKRWVIASLITVGLHAGAGIAVVSNYRPVRPLLECVEAMPDGSFVAHFGFWNRGTATKSREVGATNRFLGVEADRGQVTVFAAGRSRPFPKAAFKVVSAGLHWSGSWTARL